MLRGISRGPYLDGQLGRGGPLVVVQVLHARRKVVEAVLLLLQVPILPPGLAILSAAPVQAIAWIRLKVTTRYNSVTQGACMVQL